MSGWTWAAAHATGTSHRGSGARCQDAWRCWVAGSRPQFLVCVVSDGAGSARYGAVGAVLVCRTLGLAAQQHLRAHDRLPTDGEVLCWIDLVRDRIWQVAGQRASAAREFAATMILVISNGRQTLVAQVGDGCAALNDAPSGQWRVPLWPDHGQYASSTSFVTDDQEVRCRIVREDSALAGLAVLTDGLERIALGFAAQTPFAGFFDGVARPVLASMASGKDALLSAQLKAYLEGQAVCARTDDDKTLVVAATRALL